MMQSEPESKYLKDQRDDILKWFTQIRAVRTYRADLEETMRDCERQYLALMDERIARAEECERKAASAPALSHLLTVAEDTNKSVHAQMGDMPVQVKYLRSRRDPAVDEFVHAVVLLDPPERMVRKVIGFVFDLYFKRRGIKMQQPVSKATAQDYAYRALRDNKRGLYRFYGTGRPFLDFRREVAPLVRKQFDFGY